MKFRGRTQAAARKSSRKPPRPEWIGRCEDLSIAANASRLTANSYRRAGDIEAAETHEAKAQDFERQAEKIRRENG